MWVTNNFIMISLSFPLMAQEKDGCCVKAPTGFCELFPREMGGGRAAFSLLSPLPAGREGARPPWSGPLARRFLLWESVTYSLLLLP